MNELNQGKLIGRTIQWLSTALDFQSKNHTVIASNLANIDTPGYRPKKLVFDQALREAMDRNSVPMRATNPKHFSGQGQDVGEKPYRVQIEGKSNSVSNQLNIDQEMSKMAQNNLLFEASVKLLSKKFEALRTAIGAGRR